MRGYEVYVGDLPVSATEQLLYNSFMAFGVINSVKIMRHIVTRRSRGFGFINFKSQISADRAIEKMHNAAMMGGRIKVYSKSRYLSVDRNCKLLLLNLPTEYSLKELEGLCKPYGGVFSVTMARQDVQVHESANHEEMTRRRGYVLFETVKDGLRFWKEQNGKGLKAGKVSTAQEGGNEVENKELNVEIVFAHALRLISLRGPKAEDVKKLLSDKLDGSGEYKINSLKESNNGAEFIATLEFESPARARELYMQYKSAPQDFPEFTACEDPLQAPKRGQNRLKRDNRLFCRIYLSQKINEGDWSAKLLERYPEFKNGSLERMNSGEWRFEAVFINVKSLSKFVYELENRVSPLSPEVDGVKKEVEYSRTLIKSMKTNRWNQMYQRAQFQRQNFMAQMMPWMQQGGGQMGRGMQMGQMGNMGMQMGQMGQMGNMGNMGQMGMQMNQMGMQMGQMGRMNNGGMMQGGWQGYGPNQMRGYQNNRGPQMPKQRTANVQNHQNPVEHSNKAKHGFLNEMNGTPAEVATVKMTVKKPTLSGLESILEDLETFKKLKKEEQNSLFLEIMRSKMESMGDQRFKNEDFMREVESFFLDDSVVDLDERLQILAEDQRVADFLRDLASEQ